MSDLNSVLTQIVQKQRDIAIKLNGPEITKMGNQFNGIQQLVITDQNGKIPSSLLIDYINLVNDLSQQVRQLSAKVDQLTK